MRMMNNKGQIAIFVIVAIVIVAVIILLIFFLNTKDVSLKGQSFDNLENYISDCVKDNAEKILEEMLAGGGFVEPRDTILYQGNEITYLCKNINNFEPCINQYPVYLTQVEKEFEEQIQSDAVECFSNLKKRLEDKNYDVNLQGSSIEVEVTLNPGVIQISLNGEVTISKSGDSRKFNKFESFMQSKIYDIGFVVNEIVAQEARWCYFSNDGFMALYPEYDIRVFMMEDTTKIYTVENKKTGETLKMATRGCALPAGWY
jgi:hypothetical protein